MLLDNLRDKGVHAGGVVSTTFVFTHVLWRMSGKLPAFTHAPEVRRMSAKVVFIHLRIKS